MRLRAFAWLRLLCLVHSVTSARLNNLRSRDQRQLSAPEAIVSSHPHNATTNASSSLPLHTLDDEPLTIHKIYGGTEAQPDDALFFVMMLVWNNQTNQYEFDGCGGSLVSERHILTAGHCAKQRNPMFHAAYVHAYQPYAGNPGIPYHVSRVANYTTHPDFDDASNANDLSIITLETPVPLGAAHLVRLAGAYLNVWETEMMQVYGFGWTASNVRDVVPTLRTVDLPFISRDKCRQNYYGDHVMDDMICAGYKDGGHDACNGDSGGPMIVRKGNQTFQAGIVSWGQGCGQPNKPGVYISVQYHYKWIQETVCSALPGNETSAPICENYKPPAVYTVSSSTKTCTKHKVGQRCRVDKDCCSWKCERGRFRTYGVCRKSW